MAPRRVAPTFVGQQLVNQFGHRDGVIDGALPTVVFVILHATAGLVPAAIGAASAGMAIVVLRLFRKQSPQQAITGFLGPAFASFLALRTHQAGTFYLPGILGAAAYTFFPLVSVLVRQPLAGHAAALVDGRWTAWRENPALRKAASRATWLWTVAFGVKTGVQVALYVTDHVDVLGIVKLAMGWPLLVACLFGCGAIMKRGVASAAAAA